VPIINMQRRLAEVGRIRIGEQVSGVSQRSGKEYTAPKRLEKFRLTSPSQQVLDLLARVYGGEVRPWENAPTGNQWELYTESDALSVLVPPEGMALSQFYEQWTGGGCTARCDSQWDFVRDQPCSCSPDPEFRACKPHTRLTLMIEEAAAQGMWRLDTQGYYAATELGGAFELAMLVQETTRRALLKGTLRLDRREVKRPDEPAKKFVVPVLTFEMPGQGLTPLPPSLGEALGALDVEVPSGSRAEPIATTGLAPGSSTSLVPELRDALRSKISSLTDAQKVRLSDLWGEKELPAVQWIVDLMQLEIAEDLVAQVIAESE
jgi:Recombination directionality factor-like